ncbi:uncharacterized protein TNCT_395311 [Trichonephila clavata]|uniref:Uncharacterized protein n=1 Tax=Trichonephila clavata TaxID=2740835 RepID=A0A8X6G5W1_TRICU|nr:uncharacterized protein TNCT_395311 [Trichonephila clavata]
MSITLKNAPSKKKKKKHNVKSIIHISPSSDSFANRKRKKMKPPRKKRRNLFSSPENPTDTDNSEIVDDIPVLSIPDPSPNKNESLSDMEIPVLSIPDPSPNKNESLSAMEILSNIVENKNTQSPILKAMISSAKILAEKGGRLNSTHVRALEFSSSVENEVNDQGKLTSKQLKTLSKSDSVRSSSRLKQKKVCNSPSCLSSKSPKSVDSNKEENKCAPIEKSNVTVDLVESTIEQLNTCKSVPSSVSDVVLSAMQEALQSKSVNSKKQNSSDMNDVFNIAETNIDPQEFPVSKMPSNSPNIKGMISREQYFPNSSDSDSDFDNLPICVIAASLCANNSKAKEAEVNSLGKNMKKSIHEAELRKKHTMKSAEKKSLVKMSPSTKLSSESTPLQNKVSGMSEHFSIPLKTKHSTSQKQNIEESANCTSELPASSINSEERCSSDKKDFSSDFSGKTSSKNESVESNTDKCSNKKEKPKPICSVKSSSKFDKNLENKNKGNGIMGLSDREGNSPFPLIILDSDEEVEKSTEIDTSTIVKTESEDLNRSPKIQRTKQRKKNRKSKIGSRVKKKRSSTKNSSRKAKKNFSVSKKLNETTVVNEPGDNSPGVKKKRSSTKNSSREGENLFNLSKKLNETTVVNEPGNNSPAVKKKRSSTKNSSREGEIFLNLSKKLNETTVVNEPGDNHQLNKDTDLPLSTTILYGSQSSPIDKKENRSERKLSNFVSSPVEKNDVKSQKSVEKVKVSNKYKTSKKTKSIDEVCDKLLQTASQSSPHKQDSSDSLVNNPQVQLLKLPADIVANKVNEKSSEKQAIEKMENAIAASGNKTFAESEIALKEISSKNPDGNKELVINSELKTNAEMDLGTKIISKESSNINLSVSNVKKRVVPPPKKRIRPVPVMSPCDQSFSPFSPFSSPAHSACLDLSLKSKEVPSLSTDPSNSEKRNTEILPEPEVTKSPLKIEVKRKCLSGKPKSMAEFYKNALPNRDGELPISPDPISSSSCTIDTFLARREMSILSESPSKKETNLIGETSFSKEAKEIIQKRKLSLNENQSSDEEGLIKSPELSNAVENPTDGVLSESSPIKKTHSTRKRKRAINENHSSDEECFFKSPKKGICSSKKKKLSLNENESSDEEGLIKSPPKISTTMKNPTSHNEPDKESFVKSSMKKICSSKKKKLSLNENESSDEEGLMKSPPKISTTMKNPTSHNEPDKESFVKSSMKKICSSKKKKLSLNENESSDEEGLMKSPPKISTTMENPTSHNEPDKESFVKSSMKKICSSKKKKLSLNENESSDEEGLIKSPPKISTTMKNPTSHNEPDKESFVKSSMKKICSSKKKKLSLNENESSDEEGLMKSPPKISTTMKNPTSHNEPDKESFVKSSMKKICSSKKKKLSLNENESSDEEGLMKSPPKISTTMENPTSHNEPDKESFVKSSMKKICSSKKKKLSLNENESSDEEGLIKSPPKISTTMKNPTSHNEPDKESFVKSPMKGICSSKKKKLSLNENESTDEEGLIKSPKILTTMKNQALPNPSPAQGQINAHLSSDEEGLIISPVKHHNLEHNIVPTSSHIRKKQLENVSNRNNQITYSIETLPLQNSRNPNHSLKNVDNVTEKSTHARTSHVNRPQPLYKIRQKSRLKEMSNPYIPAGVKFPSKWSNSTIYNYSTAIKATTSEVDKKESDGVSSSKGPRRSRPSIKVAFKSPAKRNSHVKNSFPKDRQSYSRYEVKPNPPFRTLYSARAAHRYNLGPRISPPRNSPYNLSRSTIDRHRVESKQTIPDNCIYKETEKSFLRETTSKAYEGSRYTHGYKSNKDNVLTHSDSEAFDKSSNLNKRSTKVSDDKLNKSQISFPPETNFTEDFHSIQNVSKNIKNVNVNNEKYHKCEGQISETHIHLISETNKETLSHDKSVKGDSPQNPDSSVIAMPDKCPSSFRRTGRGNKFDKQRFPCDNPTVNNTEKLKDRESLNKDKVQEANTCMLTMPDNISSSFKKEEDKNGNQKKNSLCNKSDVSKTEEPRKVIFANQDNVHNPGSYVLKMPDNIPSSFKIVERKNRNQKRNSPSNRPNVNKTEESRKEIFVNQDNVHNSGSCVLTMPDNMPSSFRKAEDKIGNQKQKPPCDNSDVSKTEESRKGSFTNQDNKHNPGSYVLKMPDNIPSSFRIVEKKNRNQKRNSPSNRPNANNTEESRKGTFVNQDNFHNLGSCVLTMPDNMPSPFRKAEDKNVNQKQPPCDKSDVSKTEESRKGTFANQDNVHNPGSYVLKMPDNIPSSFRIVEGKNRNQKRNSPSNRPNVNKTEESRKETFVNQDNIHNSGSCVLTMPDNMPSLFRKAEDKNGNQKQKPPCDKSDVGKTEESRKGTFANQDNIHYPGSYVLKMPDNIPSSFRIVEKKNRNQKQKSPSNRSNVNKTEESRREKISNRDSIHNPDSYLSTIPDNVPSSFRRAEDKNGNQNQKFPCNISNNIPILNNKESVKDGKAQNSNNFLLITMREKPPSSFRKTELKKQILPCTVTDDMGKSNSLCDKVAENAKSICNLEKVSLAKPSVGQTTSSKSGIGSSLDKKCGFSIPQNVDLQTEERQKEVPEGSETLLNSENCVQGQNQESGRLSADQNELEQAVAFLTHNAGGESQESVTPPSQNNSNINSESQARSPKDFASLWTQMSELFSPTESQTETPSTSRSKAEKLMVLMNEMKGFALGDVVQQLEKQKES